MTLKPCPFCGSKRVEAEIIGTQSDVRHWAVVCGLCGARGPWRIHYIGMAEEDWNKRDERNAE